VIRDLPVLESKDIPEDTLFVLSDVHMGTVTGRITSDRPNICNIPRSNQSLEYKFEECRLREKEFGYKICDMCDQRFQCWTASRPERITFMSPELDYTQMHLRMGKLMYEAFENKVCEIYGVPKDVLG
jgi:hypothetical protein